MKKNICYLVITFFFGAFSIFAQSGAYTQSFNGNLKGASISGSIKYRAGCYLGNPFISAAIGNIVVNSYTYKGVRYSGNEIPGYTFPVKVKNGYLRIESSFQYGSNSRMETTPTHFSINSSISGGVVGAFMNDNFGWEDEKRVKELLKAHGMKNCGDDWGKKLGGIISLSIIDGAIGVDRELESAIDKLLKENEVNVLLEDAYSQLSYLNYNNAEELFKDVLRKDSNNQKAKEGLSEIQKIRENKALEDKFISLIEKGDDYQSNKNFKKAKEEYKRALATGFDDEKAQNRIWDAEAAIEEENSKKLADALRTKKEENKRNQEAEAELNEFKIKLAEKRKKDAEDEAEKTKANEVFDDGGQASRNIRKRMDEAEAERQRMFKQSMDNIAIVGGELLGNFIGHIYERKEQERLKKLEEKRIENKRIAEKKRIEEKRRIAEEKRLNELKNKPEYVNFLDNALNDVFYFDSSGKKVDQKNATYEQVYIKQDNGFYVAKYFNLKEEYLVYDISYEIIPNPFIESLKTGPSIKYGALNTKEEINYYYRNKLKQKTLNLWWRKKMYFEFYNYKDEKVFASGEILRPETMLVSSSGAITSMEYKIKSKRGKFKNYRFSFDYEGNIESLYITNEKLKIEERYKFSKY